MKLSTKGHYGMHAMINLGKRYGEGTVLLREICETHGLSEKYEEQLLRSLRQAGLVDSVRGAKGGFWLTRPPDEITVLEIVEALEGSLHQKPSRCRAGTDEVPRCALFDLWRDATESMREVLAKTTLGDILRRQEQLEGGAEAPDYSI